jgi:hypothetical protein
LMLVIALVAVRSPRHRLGSGDRGRRDGHVCALVGGPVSGASMNPARSLGPALVAGDLDGLWIYLVAPVVGATVAAFGYERLRRGRAASASSIP